MPTQCRRAFATLSCLRVLLLGLACGPLGLISGRAGGAPPRAVEGGRITVIFHGLRDKQGYLRVGLYDRPDGFPNSSPIARRDIPLQTSARVTALDALTVTFDGLPSGVYAVCAFHDRDGTGRLARNFLGIPREEWGMSGNPRPRFRAPRFQEAEIGLKLSEEKAIVLALHL